MQYSGPGWEYTNPANVNADTPRGWANMPTRRAVEVLDGEGYVYELCNRAYSEKITPAKVEKESKRVYGERFAILPNDHADIDWHQIAQEFTQWAKEWAEFD